MLFSPFKLSLDELTYSQDVIYCVKLANIQAFSSSLDLSTELHTTS